MKKFLLLAIDAAVIFFASGCLPIEDVRPLAAEDIQPPVFLDLEPKSGTEITLYFDKYCSVAEGTLAVVPDLGTIECRYEAETVIIAFEKEQEMGTEYLLEATVEDEKGNSMSFITRFFGYNPYLPEIVINEFTCQGSGNHPDVVELYVKSDGNLAGITVCEGTKENWDDRLIFPDVSVVSGDYMVVHFKPVGTAEEVNETEDKTASGGLDATDTAYDFWVEEGGGLSGNNGIITLYSTPRGTLLDCVLYSNRTSQSDENYRGFGTKKVMEWADRIAEEGGWKMSGAYIAPEDAVNPEDSTATRSICRDSQGKDTDSSADWHIVPTSTATFGAVNSDEVYAP